jgi:hypothetical protein
MIQYLLSEYTFENYRAFKQYAGASVIHMAPNYPAKMTGRVVPDRRSFKQRKQSANRL